MFRKLLFLLCALFCIVSCTSMPNATSSRTPALVLELSRSTVALVRMDEEGEVHPFCSGVWISTTQFMTAAHCVRDDLDLPVKTVNYTMSESGRLHVAGVTKVDAKADLALLTDIFPASHASVAVALEAPAQGDVVHIFGHLRGFWWTYLRGYVAASARKYDTSFGLDGPFLQIEAPVAPGSSGGGAFNAFGELVGICSWTRRDVPSEGFFIHTSTIRKFLQV